MVRELAHIMLKSSRFGKNRNLLNMYSDIILFCYRKIIRRLLKDS